MLCDNLEGWNGVGDGRGFRREGTGVHLWPLRVDKRQRPTQFCTTVVLQPLYIVLYFSIMCNYNL